jgi:carbonic anhydrase/acetyltransferase-like protein (isoleucine patch superfamily)
MAIIKELRGVTPVVGEGTFVAENASLIGAVEIGKECSIWYGAVLRGDVGAIRIGNYSNVQDNAILHATYGESECVIG